MKLPMKGKNAGLLLGVVAVLMGLQVSGGITEAAEESRAQQDLRRQEQEIREDAARKSGIKEDANKEAVVPVKSVRTEGNRAMSEKEILRLLPELKKKEVNVHTLSQELQMVNDNGALTLGAELQPDGDAFAVVIHAEEKETEHVGMQASNTGDAYTGEWRAMASYINTNISNKNDTFGISYVTSPGHWDDVKQIALSYRLPHPEEHGSWNVRFGYSDSNLGEVYSLPGILDLSSSGKSVTFGLHYQKNVTYTSREKDIWDFGIDYKKYSNHYNWHMLGQAVPVMYNYHITTASADFIHIDRGAHHAFTYDIGYVRSLAGNAEDYARATAGSDRNFGYLKADASYLMPFAEGWQALFKLHGQFTNNRLVSTEQIGIGGLYSIRGFTERALAADTGITGTAEIYTPEVLPHSRFVFFVDAGDITSNNEYAAFHHERLASAGIGFRYNAENVSVQLDYAKIIDDADSVRFTNKENNRRWNFVMSVAL